MMQRYRNDTVRSCACIVAYAHQAHIPTLLQTLAPCPLGTDQSSASRCTGLLCCSSRTLGSERDSIKNMFLSWNVCVCVWGVVKVSGKWNTHSWKNVRKEENNLEVRTEWNYISLQTKNNRDLQSAKHTVLENKGKKVGWGKKKVQRCVCVCVWINGLSLSSCNTWKWL